MFGVSTSNGTTIERGVAVAGLVQNVRVDLTYENIGRDPALGSEIQFTLPEGFFYTSAIAPGEEVSAKQDCSLSYPYIQYYRYSIDIIYSYFIRFCSEKFLRGENCFQGARPLF